MSIFEQCYRCYPVTFIDKAHLENGDKVVMPPSALDRLASLHIEYPMLFQLTNDSVQKTTHCGVLEFTSDEGLVYLPYWMMQNMSLQEGDIVKIKNVSLVKGSFIKLQPHTQDFLEVSNPKAILEKTLRSYSCLTKGDTIMVPYNNKKYFINVVETKPGEAVSIIETDCEVDFAPPLDYKEPEKKTSLSKKRGLEVVEEGEEEPMSKVAKFTPFSGSGKRLDGKPQTEDSKPNESGNEGEKLSSSVTPRKKSGKVVFGGSSNSKPTGKETVKAKFDSKKIEQETSTKSEEAKFQAFSGKKYSLQG